MGGVGDDFKVDTVLVCMLCMTRTTGARQSCDWLGAVIQRSMQDRTERLRCNNAITSPQ